MMELKKNDMVKVHIYDTAGKEIKTRNYDKVFRICEENGTLGIYWTEEFAPLDTFAYSVEFELLQKNTRFEELEQLLNSECEKYENDCSKCPYNTECNEYCKLSNTKKL